MLVPLIIGMFCNNQINDLSFVNSEILKKYIEGLWKWGVKNLVLV